MDLNAPQRVHRRPARGDAPGLWRGPLLPVVLAALWLASSGGAAEPLRLAFGGDAMLARGVTQGLREHGLDYPLGAIAPELRRADLALVNLECVLGRAGNPFMPSRVFYFRADARAAQSLARAGIDFVSLANNHVMDYRAEGLAETRALLGAVGVAHAGAGPDLATAAAPAWLEARGQRVAVLAFADHFAEYAAGARRAGIHHLPASPREAVLGPLRRAIAALRAEGAQWVVLSVHWGANWDDTPTPEIRAFAHALIDAGADVVHGHSAHVFQGVEFRGRGVVLYGTGALVDDYRLEPGRRNDLQALFVVEAGDTGITAVELMPLRISQGRVEPAEGEAREAVIERARSLGTAFGTPVLEQAGRVLALPPAPPDAQG